MTTELISFRLSNKELDWLQEQRQPGESLNLAAKRVLLSLSQGVNTVDSNDTFVQAEELSHQFEQRFKEIEERLKKLKA